MWGRLKGYLPAPSIDAHLLSSPLSSPSANLDGVSLSPIRSSFSSRPTSDKSLVGRRTDGRTDLARGGGHGFPEEHAALLQSPDIYPNPNPDPNPTVPARGVVFFGDGEERQDESGHGGGGRQDQGENGSHRRVWIGDVDGTHTSKGAIAGNTVHTSKYTVLTFIPRNLFEQFHRLAYIYFLVIVVLNQIPQLAVFGRTASLFPLLFVVIVTAVKDAYEDWFRHKSDHCENGRKCLVLTDGRYQFQEWKNVRVGDIVKLGNNEIVPCDIVLLDTCYETRGCHVSTVNLDGESNLKARNAYTEMASQGATKRAGHDLACWLSSCIVCEMPHRNIYEFAGYLKLYGKKKRASPEEGRVIGHGGDDCDGLRNGDGDGDGASEMDQYLHVPLSIKNVVLRGCEIKNTQWVVGVAVYTGMETKVMLNSCGAQSKSSRLERLMNTETIWLAAMLILLCLISSISFYVWLDGRDLDKIPFYDEDEDQKGKVEEAMGSFFRFVIVYQVIVPISLYISMELVRLGQSYLMVRDLMMWHEESNTFLGCRALNINEDLGQIRYVFADKTGTLTENQMVLRTCSIRGVHHDLKYDEEEGDGEKREREMEKGMEGGMGGGKYSAFVLARKDQLAKCEDPHGGYDGASVPIVQGTEKVEEKGSTRKRGRKPLGTSAQIRQLFTSRKNDAMDAKMVHDFFLVLVLCNTVAPAHEEGGGRGGTMKVGGEEGKVDEKCAVLSQCTEDMMMKEKKMLDYEGESPDELALVEAAAIHGYTLLQRTSEFIILDVHGEVQRYKILGLHEFDSTRKRMSIVVECPDGSLKLLCKGADASVLPLLQPDLDVSSSPSSSYDSLDEKALIPSTVIELTNRHLHQYAGSGLRTLVLASRDLDAVAYRDWCDTYRAANSAIESRGELLRAVAMAVETEMTLLGAVGIEDKLQEGVSDTIALLRKAGMRVWVLTGDKQETAMAIALSCELLTEEMTQIIINENTKEGCRKALCEANRQYLPPGATGSSVANVPLQQRRFWKALLGGERESSDKSSWIENLCQTLTRGVYKVIPGGGGHANKADVHDASFHRAPPDTQQLALIIDGDTLAHAQDEDLEQELYNIARACRVVICCRAAPLQKAGVVGLIKRKSGGDMTLAIGDGANDVSMIQMADVGIGISGQEGRQAVMASDFSIARFKYLGRLLLVHGHWNYTRMAYMVLYNFYRNAFFVFILFWHVFHNTSSSQMSISDLNLIFFTLVYTSAPTIVVAILDQDVSHQTLLSHPALYGSGQRDEDYNKYLFWATMADAIWQSLVVFYGAFFAFAHSTASLWEVGCFFTLAATVVATLHLACDTRHWTWINHVVLWGSVATCVICLLIFDSIASSPQYMVFYLAIQDARYWLLLLLVVIAAILPRVFVKAVLLRWWPRDSQIAREQEHQLDRKCKRRRPESTAKEAAINSVAAAES